MMSIRPIRVSLHPSRKTERAVIFLLAFLALASGRLQAQCGMKDATSQPYPERFNIVLSERLFGFVNKNDVTAALRAWSEYSVCIMHMNAQVKIEVIDSHSELRRRLFQGTVDILVLDNMEFLKLSDAGLVEGVAVSSGSGRLLTLNYLLLVGEQTTSLSQLRLRRAVFHANNKSAGTVAWMSILLAQNHLGRLETFFGPSAVTSNVSNCILPLFFSKIEACVIDSRDWELAKEMNPQLGRKLKVMAQSIPVLDGVIASPKTRRPKQQKMLEGLLDMNRYPAGEQILSVFKSGPLIPYRPEYLSTTRVFWDQFAQTLPPTERAVWIESNKYVIPKQFVLPAGYESDTAARR